jgi:hypothetical protein
VAFAAPILAGKTDLSDGFPPPEQVMDFTSGSSTGRPGASAETIG